MYLLFTDVFHKLIVHLEKIKKAASHVKYVRRTGMLRVFLEKVRLGLPLEVKHLGRREVSEHRTGMTVRKLGRKEREL